MTSEREETKAATHERIVASASKLMRWKGLAAASIPRVMRGAGLTVGGFYAHFRSKRAMDADVLRRTLAKVHESWFAGLEDSRGLDWMARVVKRYLTAAHRDAPEIGCPLPAPLSELTRADKRPRAAMAEIFEHSVGAIATHAPPAPGVSKRERAIATLALCVGGLAIARALRGQPISDEVLQACRKWALV